MLKKEKEKRKVVYDIQFPGKLPSPLGTCYHTYTLVKKFSRFAVLCALQITFNTAENWKG